MHVSIEYCGMWNYQPRAAGLAEAIKGELSIETELIEGSGGVFDVHVDGELIYSRKQQDGRFPEHDEILDTLKQRA